MYRLSEVANIFYACDQHTAPCTLQSFASFWKFPYILSFAYIPSTQSLKAAKPPLRFPGAGILLFAKGAPFAQFTKMSAKDGWAMLLWTHSIFRACGVSCASFLLSAAGCLIEYVHVYTLHKLPGVQPMVTVQCSFAFCPNKKVRYNSIIVVRQRRVNACALVP